MAPIPLSPSFWMSAAKQAVSPIIVVLALFIAYAGWEFKNWKRKNNYKLPWEKGNKNKDKKIPW